MLAPLESDEGVGLPGHGADRDAFGLGPFVVAAGVVERCRELLGDDALDHVGAVEHEVAGLVDDREGPAAVGQDLVDVTVAVGIAAQAGSVGHGVASELAMFLQRLFVGEERVVQVVLVGADPMVSPGARKSSRSSPSLAMT